MRGFLSERIHSIDYPCFWPVVLKLCKVNLMPIIQLLFFVINQIGLLLKNVSIFVLFKFLAYLYAVRSLKPPDKRSDLAALNSWILL
ncbi:hypothetical protein BD408DRAFT_471403 [Parasitella parasitica]|nr:hypothetical protein BD408DRAFT_471403 [Parasitella parasitica]